MEEFKRKLASIRKVSSISPIEGADNIELVTVDGWQCISKKGEFSEGDICVYFEIDSFLPIRSEFEFLRKSSYKKMGFQEGFRLKTIRLRGQISQGLILPIASFKEIEHIHKTIRLSEIVLQESGRVSNEGIFEGHDVTELLGVIKYDPPIPACIAGKAKGNLPSFIRKTDQERIQNLWRKIKDCGESFEVTVKLDGASCTYYLKDGVFGVCSRNLDLKETEGNTLWNIARADKIEEILREYGKNIALQGEVIGEGIQGNPEEISGQQFYLFDIWDIDNQRYYMPKERFEVYFDNWFGKIRHVPFKIPEHVLLSEFYSINDILNFADGQSLNPDTRREGLVFKSNDSNLTFKVISNQYLLKND